MYKYLLIFITLLTSLHAEDIYKFEVENPTMGKAYYDLFNAISALMQSATYGEILHLVFTLGAFFVFTMGVFKALQGSDPKAALADTAKYLIAGTMLMLAVLPDPNKPNSTATMVVESRVIPSSYCSTRPALNAGAVDINNYSGFTVSMPNTLAFMFSTINRIGKSTTDLAAAAFSGVSTDTQVSNSLSDMSASGFGGGLRTTQSLTGITFQGALDPAYADATQDSPTYGILKNGDILNVYFQEFLFECVYMTSSPDQKTGITTLEAMSKTKNIKRTLDDLLGGNDTITTCHNLKCDDATSKIITGTKPSQLLFTVNDDSGNTVTGTCQQFWKEVIKPSLDGIDNDNLLCGAGLYNDITPGGMYLMTGDDASASAASVNEIAINQGLINMHRKATSNIYVGDSINYAAGKSQAEFITQSVGAGQYMAQMLPYLQMGIRAVLYAFFPFVFLAMLLPGGLGVIKNYFSTMLWVELWSPVAAILNMFLGYFQMDRIGDIYNGGLNAITTTSIVSDSSMLASVAGYLYMSVPALTWLIIKGSAQMIGSISAGVSSGFAKNLDSTNIRKDISDKTKANEFNKANGTNESMSQVLMDLEKLDAGIQGGSMGKAINYAGGQDKYMHLSQKDKALKTINSLSHAKKSSVEAQEALGEGKATDENAQLHSTGQLTKEGAVDHKKVETINAAKGIEKGSDDLKIKKNVDFLADQSGVDITTVEGQSKVANVKSNAEVAKAKGGFTQQVTEARQFALANGLKVNGKNPNDATVKELMQFSSTVKQEIGSQDGKNKVISNEQKEAESRSRGQASGVIKTKKDMESFAGKKFTDFKTVKGKGGKDYLVGLAADGTVYQAQKGNFLRQRNETVGNKDKGKEVFNSIHNGTDLANAGATKTQAMGVQNELNANAAYNEKVQRYTDNLNRKFNSAKLIAESRVADQSQKIAAMNETKKQLLSDSSKDIKMTVQDKNGEKIKTNLQEDTVRQAVSMISPNKTSEEIETITKDLVGSENVEAELDNYGSKNGVSKENMSAIKAEVAYKQMGVLNARTTTWNQGVAQVYRDNEHTTVGIEANNRIFMQGAQSVPVAAGEALGQDSFTTGQISGGVGTTMLGINAVKTVAPIVKKGFKGGANVYKWFAKKPK